MKTKLYYSFFGLALFINYSIFSQTSVTLEVDGGGPNVICRGEVIQINAIATPQNDNYLYVWRNVNTGQELLREVGDPGTFFFFDFFNLITQDTTIEVQVSGGGGFASNTIQIIVETPPNPGTEGDLLLCNPPATIDLFTILEGNPEPGGTWNPPLSGGGGNFVVGTDIPGEYIYTVPGNAVCGPAESKVTVRNCSDDDFDDDGVPNNVDLDDDNDGILDTVENNTCGAGDLTEILPLVNKDFGTGSTPTTDANVLGHSYTAIWPNDGQYNVGTSTFFLNSANFDVFFVATNANPIANSDGSGNLDGRYLAINITPNFVNQPIYQITDIPIVAGTTYNFRIDLAGLCDDPGQCANVPALDLELLDQSLPPGSPPIFTETSAGLGVANDDIWRTLLLNFTATSTTFLTLNIVNQQPIGANGNDIGIDNIRFAELGCDFDRDEIPNSLDLDNDNDGIYDIVEAGFANLDTNGDGIVDGGVDANGIPIAASGGLTPRNTDGTGFADYQDIDADDDGIIDNIEAQLTAAYIAPSGNDTDRDGMDDAYDTTAIDPIDTDNDGTPDYLDLNSDEDCLDDTTEAYDLDQDGVADITSSGVDTDGDGFDDAFDDIALADNTDVTNPTDNGEVPLDFPNNHNPVNPERDWREEFTEIDEQLIVDGCAGGTATFNLFDVLVEAAIPGGTWTGPSPLGGGELGTFDPTVNVAGVYIYTLPTIGSCPPRQAEVIVTISSAPDAGTDGTLVICATQASVNLFDSLGGTPDTDGSWTDPNGDPFGTDDLGSFDPSGDDAGIYTYTVGTISCSESATVEVTINSGANSGDDATVSFCSDDSSVNLFDSLGGTPDTGGSWTDPNGNPFGNDDLGALDPTDPNTLSGDYTYTVATAACPVPSSSIVNVTVSISPELLFVATTCASDRNSYSVSFTTNGTWDLSVIPNGIGTIDVANNIITDIPAETDITLVAINPANSNCESRLDITAPDCRCPNITGPTNPVDGVICLGDPIPTLSVDVEVGQIANWYDEDGNLLQGNTTTYTPQVTEEGFYAFFVEAFDTTENCASDRIEVTLNVIEIEQVELSVQGVICIDENGDIISNVDLPVVSTFLSNTQFSFEWSFGGVVIPNSDIANIEVTQPGQYSVTYTDLLSGCFNTSTAIVETRVGLQEEDVTLSLSFGAFADRNDIVATVNRDGEYLYSLDGDPFQTSNVFSNVSLGLHEVTVEDIAGCGTVSKTIFVMGFPNFFTPNNDGFNDFWNVVGDENLPEMTIYIFDRYGRLLDQLNPNNPNSIGWDGIYNGKPLPSTDYWFVAELEDGSQTYRSHFTLKR